jgi:subtilisin family serine protease
MPAIANWLTVVAVDLNGREPSYTNRCGLAAEWCVTAPGGGDQSNSGIEAAQSGGGYTKKSGTSMAAPLVSCAVGLVLEHMPNLSPPRQAATRLKETASYDGLTASNGCTITTCSEADMAAIFGQGLIDLDAALQPIGNASLVNNSGQYFNSETSYITTPQLVGDAIKRGL